MHGNDDFRTFRLRNRTGIRVEAFFRGETEGAGATRGGLQGKIGGRLGRIGGAKDRQFEVVGVIHSGNICLGVEQPQDLIVGIAVISD